MYLLSLFTIKEIPFEFNGFSFSHISYKYYDLYKKYHSNFGIDFINSYFTIFDFNLSNSYYYTMYNDYLVTGYYVNGKKDKYFCLMGLPVKDNGEFMSVTDTMSLLKSINDKEIGKLFYVSEESVTVEEKQMFGSEWTYYKGALEHTYDNFKLAELAGGEFKNLRKSVNRFERIHNIKIVELEEGMEDVVIEIYDRWVLARKALLGNILDTKIFKSTVYNAFEVSGYRGFLIYDNDKQAYVGYFDCLLVNDDIALGMSRKLDLGYDSLPEFCQVWLARYLRDIGCRYINDGFDNKKGGLRNLKMKFHPLISREVFNFGFKAKDGAKVGTV